MSRPTPAALALARSTLPVRRVASTSAFKSSFAALLSSSAGRPAPFKAAGPTSVRFAMAAGLTHAAMLPGGGGPAPMSNAAMLANAQQLLDVPYVWGGNSTAGLDCSAFISKVWGLGRQTTDTLSNVSQAVSKNDLQAGDALNLTTGRDAGGTGHVRLFDRWANPEKTRLWVYEETPPRSIHHIINWDSSYQPMRRHNTVA